MSQSHSSSVWVVAFSHDGTHVISVSGDHLVKIWNAYMGEVELVLKGHSDWVQSVAFSCDGTWVALGSDDKSVHIWDGVTGKIVWICKGNSDWVSSIAFLPDRTCVVSGSADKMVWIWNVMTGRTKQSLQFWKEVTKANWVLNGHSSEVGSVAFSPDGTCIVSGLNDKTV